MDNTKFREFMLWMFGTMAKLESDLTAHGVTLTLLKSAMPDQTKQIDDLLEQAKKHPSPMLAERHREIRESVERLLDQENLESGLAKFLQDWKPNGPVH